MSSHHAPLVPAVLVGLALAVFAPAAEPADALKLKLRSRGNLKLGDRGLVTEKAAAWDAKKVSIDCGRRPSSTSWMRRTSASMTGVGMPSSRASAPIAPICGSTSPPSRWRGGGRVRE